MHRRIASFVLFSLLAGALLCHAERLKVQVVQTHTGIKLGSSSMVNPEGASPSGTRCTGDSGSYTKDRGFSCHHSAGHDASAPAADRSDYSLFFDVIVIMPDAKRVVFHCSTILDAGCEGFPVYPENTSVECSNFQHDGTSYKDCTAKGSSPTGIGVYQASVHGDRMTIFGPNWERHYQKYGTWEYPDPPAQDPRPAMAREIKVAAVQEPKLPPRGETAPPVPQEGGPAATQDANPAAAPEPATAAPQDPKPALNQEPKPAPQPADPPTQESKPATPADPPPASQPDSKPSTPDAQTAPAQDPPPSAPQDGDPATANTATGPGSAVSALTSAATVDQVDPSVIEQAKAGDAAAQYKLGYDYYRGRGVALDYVQAAIWWRKAADQGFPQAQNNLGVLYNSGKGVPQSYAEAYFWQNLAASRASGLLQAQFAKNRDESASRLWFYERSKVQKRAAKWAAEHPVAPRAQEPRQAPKEQ